MEPPLEWEGAAASSEVPRQPDESQKAPPNPLVSDFEKDDLGSKESTPVDVKEYPSKYLFVADVPGLKSHQIRVRIEEKNVLAISGERKREEEEEKDEEKDVKYLLMERKVRKFVRRFSLPENCKQGEISASCVDGVLTVTVPKLLHLELNNAATFHIQVLEKNNSMENNRGVNEVSMVEESLSNTTSSPNVSICKRTFQEPMKAEQECNPLKHISDLNSEQRNPKEGTKTSRTEKIASSEADLEMLSVDFSTDGKDAKNELWPHFVLTTFLSKVEGVYNRANNGYLGKKHWDQIANETNQACNSSLTGLQCRDKWNRLKKILKKEKSKLNATGATSSTWPLYVDVDRIIRKSRRIAGLAEEFPECDQTHKDHYMFSKRKEHEDLLDEYVLKEEKHDPVPRRENESYFPKDVDGEGKRVKRVKSTSDSIAMAMETNMKHLTETMKEIEQNKMRQESMQLDKILQTQLQIARLFAQK
eukprot:TRINITY_DN2254_c0_g4_i1.p1 TRINITY_DN2254_c0_g4~~TRINITY_DN2254_c0_g4_i1.p1  ORF type:complete len:516 (-),score=98.86 TRINITY_DN2254_c0_g4_i1:333-1760(-)